MNPDIKNEIYLDHNATTPVLPEVAEAVLTAMRDLYGNPSSSHITGLKARQILQRARECAKTVLNTVDGEVIFNSGATESIHTAVFSALQHIRRQSSTHVPVILYGATEHKAVPEAIKHWKTILDVPCEIHAIPVDANGQIDCGFVRSFGDRLALVCTMAVNNETGVMQDLKRIESTIREVSPNALWLVDAVQALGKMTLNFSQLSVDYASFSGHKLYCPKGVGFLYVRQGAPFVALITGGGQEQGRRSGTENIPGIASLAVVLSYLVEASRSPFKDKNTLIRYNQFLTAALKDSFPEVVFNTPMEHAVPTTINFSVRGFSSKEIMDLLDAAQIRVSSGSACSSKATRSHVLDAMGLEPWRSESAIRLSFGPVVDESEIQEACLRIKSAATSLKSSCLLVNTTNEELEKVKVDGLIQIRSGDVCTQVLCSAATRHCVVIDPVPVLCERIEHLINCQGLTVLGVLCSHESGQATAQILWDMLSASKRIMYGAHCNPLKDETSEIRIDDRIRLSMLSAAHERAFVVRDEYNRIRYCFVQNVLSLQSSAIRPQAAGFQTESQSHTVGSILNSEINRPEFGEALICGAVDERHLFAISVEQLPQLDVKSNKNDAGCGAALKQIANVRAYSCSEVKSLLNQDSEVLFYDVREPYEFGLFKSWAELGFERSPENVPLSRFVAVLDNLIRDKRHTSHIVFICRSGGRSEEAANVLRRFGFDNVGHVAGGVALL